MRLPNELEWFVLALLAGYYEQPFVVYTADGLVMRGMRTKL